MTKAISVLCSVSFSCTDVCVADLGKAVKGTEQLTLVLSMAGMSSLTPSFKGCMAKKQIPYPLKR